MPQNVRAGEELNEPNLKEFLFKTNLIQNANCNLNISQFSNGYSNLTYLVEVVDKKSDRLNGTRNKEYVLRRPPFGAIKRGHDMGREYKVLSKLKKAFSKAPQAYAYTEDEVVLGAPFYIMEKMEGIILTTKEAKKRNIAPTDFPIIANSWLDTFVELHNVDYKSIGLEDLGRPNGYVERQVTNWGKQYLKAATRDVKEAQKIMEWMQENKPKEYDHCLIHNDYRYDNIVFADDSWKKVSAVLDWEMCTLGDPLMDLGGSLAYWTMASDGDMVIKGIPSPTVMPGNPSRSEIVELYAQKSGRSIKNLNFYYAFGLFKLAVIAQQIFYRYNKGLTTDKRFATLDQSAQFLCFIAWQSIQQKKIENLF